MNPILWGLSLFGDFVLGLVGAVFICEYPDGWPRFFGFVLLTAYQFLFIWLFMAYDFKIEITSRKKSK